MSNLPYDPKLKNLSKRLRKESTLSEILLWQQLKGKRIFGYKFRRQSMISNYIVDFYCKELSLIIEIDGISHDWKYEHDIQREKILKSFGLYILRFNDEDVKQNIEMVINSIETWVNNNSSIQKTNELL